MSPFPRMLTETQAGFPLLRTPTLKLRSPKGPVCTSTPRPGEPSRETCRSAENKERAQSGGLMARRAAAFFKPSWLLSLHGQTDLALPSNITKGNPQSCHWPHGRQGLTGSDKVKVKLNTLSVPKSNFQELHSYRRNQKLVS